MTKELQFVLLQKFCRSSARILLQRSLRKSFLRNVYEGFS